MRLHVPLGFAFLGEGSKYSWNYNTEPQKEFEKVILTETASEVVDSAGGLHEVESQTEEHRRGYQPRGKTLGGSSSINAMLYVRGHKWDYDHWAELGNEGWSYDEVLPYFKKYAKFLNLEIGFFDIYNADVVAAANKESQSDLPDPSFFKQNMHFFFFISFFFFF